MKLSTKMKPIAAACAALCVAGSAYATYNPTFTPANVVYIAGASAQKNALLTTVPGSAFSTTSANGVLFINGPKSSSAWLGDCAPGICTGTLMVIYNSTNGSAAGLNQLLAFPQAESNVMTPILTGCGAKTAPAAGNTATEQVTCSTGNANLPADAALSDVYKNEFQSGVLLGAGAAGLINGASTGATGLEGFGVIVNSVLYNALLTQNITDGLLPTSCSTATASTITAGTASSTNGTCQPSVRSADYAALASANNGSYAQLVPGGTDRNIFVCRRDDLSGTQAASNINFLNNVCGKTGPFFGKLPIATSADSSSAAVGTSFYTVVDALDSGTAQAENCVWAGTTTPGSAGGALGTAAMADYGIGVVSLGEKDSRDATNPQTSTAFNLPQYYFVKLDGVSPNYTANGTYDALHRANIIKGSYKFATEMGAYVVTGTSLTSGKGLITKTVFDEMAKAQLSNVTGIGYLSGTVDATKSSNVNRGGNNCQPYIKK